jgi:hypothetical protein
MIRWLAEAVPGVAEPWEAVGIAVFLGAVVPGVAGAC